MLMLPEKANIICLLEILTKYSDENNPMAMGDIIGKMEILYGMRPDRRTITSGMETLIRMGYDISTYQENKLGYYLKTRDFEPGEVRLLMDAVYSFPFIPEKQSLDLIKKLEGKLSIYERKNLNYLNLIRDGRKTLNRQVFYIIEELNRAIEEGVKVKFIYLKYNIKKNLVPRREKKYTVSPYGMVYTNGNYYLVCSLSYQENLSLYRLDRMKDVELTNYKIDGITENIKPIEAVEGAVYAFLGQHEKIKIICQAHILDYVVDSFGRDIKIREKEDGNIEVEFKGPAKGLIFWGLQYLPYAEIIEPAWVREKIIESISNNKYTD